MSQYSNETFFSSFQKIKIMEILLDVWSTPDGRVAEG